MTVLQKREFIGTIDTEIEELRSTAQQRPAADPQGRHSSSIFTCTVL
jgi:hypothetical protein